MMTKNNYLKFYRAALTERHAWAADTAKLDRFMRGVMLAIQHPDAASFAPGTVTPAAVNGDLSREVWAALGGKRRDFSIKALCALPVGG